jgi:hypothetical protein
VKRLIFWRHNRFFTFLYYLVKMYILRRKNLRDGGGALDLDRIFARSLTQELFRHEREDLPYGQSAKTAVATGGVTMPSS